MNLRHLAYFIALGREGHFRRAAQAMHVAQPTLSAAIRQLEAELGVPLVLRGPQRFDGFTPEGREVLAWAQRILADCTALKHSLGELKGQLRGHLRLGVIPTAEPVIAELTRALHDRHPGVTVTVLSHTSNEIERGIAQHELEAGVSYLDDAKMAALRALPLFQERYVVAGAARLLGRRSAMTWSEAARLPLCLLSRDMHNRQLIDEHFAAAGVVPAVVAETNTLVGVLSHVRSGGWCGVLPRAVLALVGSLEGVRTLPLHEPDVTHRVGLLFPARKPLPPLTQALVDAARRARFSTTL